MLEWQLWEHIRSFWLLGLIVFLRIDMKHKQPSTYDRVALLGRSFTVKSIHGYYVDIYFDLNFKYEYYTKLLCSYAQL